MSHSVQAVLNMMQSMALQLRVEEDLDAEAMVVDVDAVTDFVNDMRIILSDFERALEQRMADQKLYEVKGPTGPWIRQKRSDRKAWDHDRVAALVAQRAVEGREVSPGGEIADPVETALRALLRTAGISYWRMGELRMFGIDGNQYCDVTENGYTVRKK